MSGKDPTAEGTHDGRDSGVVTDGEYEELMSQKTEERRGRILTMTSSIEERVVMVV